MTKTARLQAWQELSEEEILRMRIRDFGLQIAGFPLEPLIQRLYQELDSAGLRFHPPCYLADEWLCPDRAPIIGIPFYLAHPRLRHIERKMMFEVEGGTEISCMKFLRHECGHAVNYAYELFKRTRWRELFGPFSAPYSNSYYFRPYSRRYVTHLEDNYAQAHPDEDFAETFAVWLAPAGPRSSRGWQEKYGDRPVIKKLRYVDGLMKKIGQQPPKVTAQGPPPWSASRMTSTLAAYYERKRRMLGSEFQGFYDDSLARLFLTKHAGVSDLKASQLLRRHRRELIDSVTRWTGHRKYDIHQLIDRLIVRCDALDLYARTPPAGRAGSEPDNIIGLTALLTAIASNTLRITRKP
jgi:hypothetical protein